MFWLLSGWLTSELALYERVDLIFSLTPPIAMGIGHRTTPRSPRS